MIAGVQNFISYNARLMEEKILSSLTDNQKRIAAVVAAVFTLIGALYLFSLCYQRKSDIQAKKLEKAEDISPKINEIAVPLPKEPRSRIPYMHYPQRYLDIRKECQNLFSALYDKQFLDIEKDKEIIKVIDDFGDLVQSAPNDRRIEVRFYEDDILTRRNGLETPKDLKEKGCHFHIYKKGSSTYWELAFDSSFPSQFAQEFDDSKRKTLLLKVVDEMKEALLQEEKRASEAQKK